MTTTTTTTAIRPAVLALCSAGLAASDAAKVRDTAQGALCIAVRDGLAAKGGTVRRVAGEISSAMADVTVPRGVVLPRTVKDGATVSILGLAGDVLSLPVADGASGASASSVLAKVRKLAKGATGVPGTRKLIAKCATQSDALAALAKGAESQDVAADVAADAATGESQLSADGADVKPMAPGEALAAVIARALAMIADGATVSDGARADAAKLAKVTAKAVADAVKLADAA